MCGRCRAGNGKSPGIAIAAGVAHFTGVQTCGHIWTCPVCAPKIRQERAVEIDQAMQQWLGMRFDQAPGAVLFLTLTMPHDFGDELPKMFSTQKAAWSNVFSGRRWQDDKKQFGAAHYIRAWDCTHGANGWHPHAHAVIFATRIPNALELIELEDRLYDRWARAIEDSGYRRPTRANGIKLELARSREDLAKYVAQLAVVSENNDECRIALEVARTDLKEGRKRSRTPFEILRDFATSGDCADLDLWHEWEAATPGKHAIQWSRGLRALVDVAERTDEEIAAEEIGGENIAEFSVLEWVAITHTSGAQRKLLEAAETGGAQSVAEVVRALIRAHDRRQRKKAAMLAGVT
jgi:hypothetical protein